MSSHPALSLWHIIANLHILSPKKPAFWYRVWKLSNVKVMLTWELVYPSAGIIYIAPS